MGNLEAQNRLPEHLCWQQERDDQVHKGIGRRLGESRRARARGDLEVDGTAPVVDGAYQGNGGMADAMGCMVKV